MRSQMRTREARCTEATDADRSGVHAARPGRLRRAGTTRARLAARLRFAVEAQFTLRVTRTTRGWRRQRGSGLCNCTFSQKSALHGDGLETFLPWLPWMALGFPGVHDPDASHSSPATGRPRRPRRSRRPGAALPMAHRGPGRPGGRVGYAGRRRRARGGPRRRVAPRARGGDRSAALAEECGPVVAHRRHVVPMRGTDGTEWDGRRSDLPGPGRVVRASGPAERRGARGRERRGAAVVLDRGDPGASDLPGSAGGPPAGGGPRRGPARRGAPGAAVELGE